MEKQTVTRRGMMAFIDGVHHRDGRVEVEEAVLEEARKAPLVVFRKVFEPEFLERVRSVVLDHPFKNQDYTKDSDGRLRNFTRTDDLRDRDRRARYNTGYHFFLSDPETPPEAIEMLRTTVHLGNRLCGRRPDARMVEGIDDKFAVASFYYYPPGGMLGAHHFTDDPTPHIDNFDEMVVLFSELGKDFEKGGMYIAPRHRLSPTYSPDDHGEPEFVDDQLGIGDIVAFTIREVFHKVDPIDPDRTGFDPRVGRFLMLGYYLNTEHVNSFMANQPGAAKR